MVVHCLQVGWMELHVEYEILVSLTWGDFTQGLAWVFLIRSRPGREDRCVIKFYRLATILCIWTQGNTLGNTRCNSATCAGSSHRHWDAGAAAGPLGKRGKGCFFIAAS